MDTYRQSVPRRERREVLITGYQCFGPDAAFGDGIDDEALLQAIAPTGLACDGGGNPGPWCHRCPWGEIEELDCYDEEEEDYGEMSRY